MDSGSEAARDNDYGANRIYEKSKHATRKPLRLTVGERAAVVQRKRPGTQRQARILAALGLRGIGQLRFVDLTEPAIQGMIRSVSHLVEIKPETGRDVIEVVSATEEDLEEINSKSLVFEFGNRQYLRALSAGEDVALTWSIEFSLARALKRLTHLLPASTSFEESSGETWWHDGRAAVTGSADKALNEARRSPSSVSFIRVDYHTPPSWDFSFTWLSPNSGESGYSQGGLRCPRDDFDVFSRIIPASATPRVARSLVKLLPSIREMEVILDDLQEEECKGGRGRADEGRN
ncbi:uL30 family ribosomal protein [Streptomyces ferrugineus]|uniref:UL30 family ribosomal protein n=1 Tax=Streptomyces ferrugineus TaxID=1413221 RepID=A0A7M2SLF7_9ACTN|nr:uL30 family ribosomal protein [Streptomyces ferrugineus]QOV37197.1 uL30 family ribosomal protein [Streptomyces ferrugineus]